MHLGCRIHKMFQNSQNLSLLCLICCIEPFFFCNFAPRNTTLTELISTRYTYKIYESKEFHHDHRLVARERDALRPAEFC